MPTFQLRRPTPAQRVRGPATAGSEGGANAPSVKTWISARGWAPTSARAVRTASPSRVGRSRACAWPGAVRARWRSRPSAAVTFGWTPVSMIITSAPSPRCRTSWTASPRDVEARRTDVVRLHRRRGIEHHHDLAGALAHHRGGRPRQRDGQREEGEDLEDQQRIALEALKERRRLAVAQRRIPQEQARHPPLAPADLEEIEQDERQDERREGEREGREEAHTSSRPRICASTNSSTGVSVVTRWYPISWVRLNVSARSRNCRRRSW